MRKTALLTAFLFVLTALATAPYGAKADVQDRLYDFTDAFYLQNGVDPTKIVGRRNGADGRSVFDTPIFSYQRDVRAIATNPAYNQSGAITYWSVMGDLFVDGFTNNAAGQNARQIADNMILYVFPRRDQPNPITLGANRQADIVDMRNATSATTRSGCGSTSGSATPTARSTRPRAARPWPTSSGRTAFPPTARPSSRRSATSTS